MTVRCFCSSRQDVEDLELWPQRYNATVSGLAVLSCLLLRCLGESFVLERRASTLAARPEKDDGVSAKLDVCIRSPIVAILHHSLYFERAF